MPLHLLDPAWEITELVSLEGLTTEQIAHLHMVACEMLGCSFNTLPPPKAIDDEKDGFYFLAILGNGYAFYYYHCRSYYSPNLSYTISPADLGVF